jgi:hypothetical protein
MFRGVRSRNQGRFAPQLRIREFRRYLVISRLKRERAGTTRPVRDIRRELIRDSLNVRSGERHSLGFRPRTPYFVS